jgi:hypothetical protein
MRKTRRIRSATDDILDERVNRSSHREFISHDTSSGWSLPEPQAIFAPVLQLGALHGDFGGGDVPGSVMNGLPSAPDATLVPPMWASAERVALKSDIPHCSA